jgi:hypothetical protein
VKAGSGVTTAVGSKTDITDAYATSPTYRALLDRTAGLRIAGFPIASISAYRPAMSDG